jgi:hypothetical protein
MLMISLMFSVLAQSNVVAQKQMEAGREIRVQPHVIAEVAKSQMSQMHAEKMKCNGENSGSFNGRNMIHKLDAPRLKN